MSHIKRASGRSRYKNHSGKTFINSKKMVRESLLESFEPFVLEFANLKKRATKEGFLEEKIKNAFERRWAISVSSFFLVNGKRKQTPSWAFRDELYFEPQVVLGPATFSFPEGNFAVVPLDITDEDLRSFWSTQILSGQRKLRQKGAALAEDEIDSAKKVVKLHWSKKLGPTQIIEALEGRRKNLDEQKAAVKKYRRLIDRCRIILAAPDDVMKNFRAV